jgi:hypothetical protein
VSKGLALDVILNGKKASAYLTHTSLYYSIPSHLYSPLSRLQEKGETQISG